MPMITKTLSERSVRQSETTISIQFVGAAPAGKEPIRVFTDPRPMVAIKVPTELGSHTDYLQIQCTSDFSAKPNWQPGIANISASDVDTLLPAFVDFAFYESELRRLEAAILPHQMRADADVALAYDIRESDRPQRDRLYRTMEELYRLRLQFARLEPHLAYAHRSLPVSGRRLFNRLLIKAQIESRAEAFSNRLETLEDLYEGAVDRITDHRNYHKGTLLEIGIVLLLVIEVVLLIIRHN